MTGGAKTIAFNTHEEADRHFLKRPCSDDQQCNEDLPEALPAAALAQGYKSIQFLRHRDFDCWDDAEDQNGAGHELMIFQTDGHGRLGSGGGQTCPPGIEFRTGVDADLLCECTSTANVRSVRGTCVTCAGTVLNKAG